MVLRVVLRVERLEYELIRNDSERRLESPGTNVTRTSSHGVRPSTANTLADAGALTCASSTLRAHRPIRAGGLATRSARDVPHFDELATFRTDRRAASFRRSQETRLLRRVVGRSSVAPPLSETLE